MNKLELMKILKDLPDDTKICVDDHKVDFSVYSVEDRSLDFQSQSEKYMDFDNEGNLLLYLKDTDKIVFNEVLDND